MPTIVSHMTRQVKATQNGLALFLELPLHQLTVRAEVYHDNLDRIERNPLVGFDIRYTRSTRDPLRMHSQRLFRAD